MPFHGYAKVPSLECSNALQDGIISWLVPENSFVKENTHLATIEENGMRYSLIITFPALLLEFIAKEKAHVKVDQLILKWGTDGEAIPYNHEYFLLKKVL